VPACKSYWEIPFRGFHELLVESSYVAPLPDLCFGEYKQTMADTLLRGWREGHFIRYDSGDRQVVTLDCSRY